MRHGLHRGSAASAALGAAATALLQFSRPADAWVALAGRGDLGAHPSYSRHSPCWAVNGDTSARENGMPGPNGDDSGVAYEAEVVEAGFVMGTTLGHITNVRQLEVLGDDVLRSELRLRGLPPDGSKVKLVLRLAQAMDLLRRQQPTPLPQLQPLPPRPPPAQWRSSPSPTTGEAPPDQAPPRRPEEAQQQRSSAPPKRPRNMPTAEEDTTTQLPPDPSDVKDRTYVDALYRRSTTYKTADGTDTGIYIVSTRRAMRPWDAQLEAGSKSNPVTPNDGRLPSRSFSYSSTAESHAVLVLSDVFGWESKDTRAVADEVAFVCDCMVAVPDIFRGSPWPDPKAAEPDQVIPALGGPEYEEWRAQHTPARVASDIEAAMAYVREEFRPASVGVVGMCYGGGKALELAASTGPAAPDTVVAICPTRYDPSASGLEARCPIAAIFGGADNTAGATKADAVALKLALSANEHVQDFVVRVFPGQDHGFAHRGGGGGEEVATAASDAMLLATAWLDIYLQKGAKTIGEPVKQTTSYWEE
eukprot:TRINITY_DN7164_c0_g1_i1.p1 TRINITY_DN7164_c0_g1~~TRINITY_DN7164_c0_g1_i1.p1  ORF type:complete len:531 (-),score=76.51 TRINITY_DN7164_c0_g1_i1:19-1611(-)